MRNRLAYTLIELMVVLSVSATVLGVAVGWIHQSMKIASIMRERQTHNHNLLRLARELREDVHRGKSMSVEEEERTLVVTTDDRQIRYQIQDHVVQRLDLKGERTMRQEVFSLARTAIPRWDTSEMPIWISLVVDRGFGTEVAQLSQSGTVESATDNPVDLHVRVAIGRRKQLGKVAGLSIDKEPLP